jgi:hypothetical protein
MGAMLTLLPSLITAGKDLFKMISEIRTAAKQNGEWTEAHEADFQKLLEEAASKDHWKSSE